jgi:hypothetical protein
MLRRTSMDVRIEHCTCDVVVAGWERVMLVIWRGTTTVAELRRVELFLGEHVARCKDFVLALTLVDAHAPLPSLESRRALIRLLQHANGKIERSALVVEGDWLRATSVRAVVAGASFFSRPNYPHRVFGSLASAARFLGVADDAALAAQRLSELIGIARRAPLSAALEGALPTDTGPECRWSS